MAELFDFGKKIPESQPFSVPLGTELEVFEPGMLFCPLPGATS